MADDTVYLSGSRREARIETQTGRHTWHRPERVAVIPSKRKSALILTANDARALARALSTEDELKDLADTIGRARYYSAVRSYAEEIVADLKDGTIEDRDALIERIDETADGSAMVIYTGQAMDVLRYSDNDGAYVDDFGTDGVVSDGGINWSVLAYAALQQDITEAIGAEVDLNAPFTCDECGTGVDAFSDLHEVTDTSGDMGANPRHLCDDCNDLRLQDDADQADTEGARS